MVKTHMAVGGQTGSSLNSPKFQKIYKKGFSIAEALVALLIGSLILGASAPIISKQIKHNNFSDAQVQLLLRRIEQLERRNTTVPSGAIMFFNANECPDTWTEIKNLGGKYPRIAKFDASGNLIDSVGLSLEQMVHKHKHVSPITRADWGVYRRYGPYASSKSNSVGDAVYPTMPSSLNPNIYTAYPATSYNWSWILYTSDGLNRIENLKTSSGIRNILTCPNRDEGNSICKPTGNQYDIPYLSEMPLVGNENRPNSVIWLACQKD